MTGGRAVTPLPRPPGFAPPAGHVVLAVTGSAPARRSLTAQGVPEQVAPLEFVHLLLERLGVQARWTGAAALTARLLADPGLRVVAEAGQLTALLDRNSPQSRSRPFGATAASRG